MTGATVYLLQLQNKDTVYLLVCRVAKIRHQHNSSSSVFNSPTHSRRRIFLHDILKTYISTCFPREVQMFGKRARSSQRVLWPYNTVLDMSHGQKSHCTPPKKFMCIIQQILPATSLSSLTSNPSSDIVILHRLSCVWLWGGDNVKGSCDMSHASQRQVVTSVYKCAHGVTSSPSSRASTQRSLSSFETVTGCQECVHTDTRTHTDTRHTQPQTGTHTDTDRDAHTDRDTHRHRQRHTQTQTETHTNVDLLPTASNHTCTVLYHIYAHACT